MDKIQMDAVDLSAKISAIRHSILSLLPRLPDPEDQKAIFGAGLLLEKIERDASKIANKIDSIS